MTPDLDIAFDAVARSLREFGYPDVTGLMVREIHTAWLHSKPLPHGIIGMFASRKFEKHPMIFGVVIPMTKP